MSKFNFSDLEIIGTNSGDTGIVHNVPEAGLSSVRLRHKPTGETGFVQLPTVPRLLADREKQIAELKERVEKLQDNLIAENAEYKRDSEALNWLEKFLLIDEASSIETDEGDFCIWRNVENAKVFSDRRLRNAIEKAMEG